MGILFALEGAVAQGILWGIMALGVYLTFRILDFADLTVEGTFALGGCVSSMLLIQNINPILSVLIAFLAGGLAGVVTGILHTKLKIAKILAGILPMIALYSINIRIMKGKPNNSLLGVSTIITFWETHLGLDKTLVSLIIGIIFCAIIIALLYYFFGTEIGSVIRATGNNEKMVRAQGVNTDLTKIIGLAISNALVALSGALVSQSQGYADVGMGTGSIVIGLASIIIGEVLFAKAHSFSFILIGVVVGSIVYRMIIAIVLQLGMKSSDLKLLTAILVAIALAIPVIKKNLTKKRIVPTDDLEIQNM
jgi:putative tryptophan/tyrosine transport system permease protein